MSNKVGLVSQPSKLLKYTPWFRLAQRKPGSRQAILCGVTSCGFCNKWEKGSVTYAQLPGAVETAAAVSEATKERLCATFKLDMQKNVPFKEAL